MKSIGMVISHKENENRRALVPKDVATIKNKNISLFRKDMGKYLVIQMTYMYKQVSVAYAATKKCCIKTLYATLRVAMVIIWDNCLVKPSLDGYMQFKNVIFVTKLQMED